MLGNMNNVLVIVFSSEFFGPIEPMVAAMYIIPFFGLVMPSDIIPTGAPEQLMGS